VPVPGPFQRPSDRHSPKLSTASRRGGPRSKFRAFAGGGLRDDLCLSSRGVISRVVTNAAQRARVARSAVYRPVRPVIKTGETRGYSRRPMRCRYVVVSRNCAAVCDGSAVRRSNSAPSAVIALAIDVRMPVTQSVWEAALRADISTTRKYFQL
jgi:hypothetical protein